MAVAIEMGTRSGVEDDVVFEDGDGGFDGVKRRTIFCEDVTAGVESAFDTGAAIGNGGIGNVPSAAVNDEGKGPGIHVR